MRKIQLIKTTACIAGSLLCGAFAFALLHVPAFENGERYEFYLGTSSSPVVSSQNPALDKLLMGVSAGESVRYRGDRWEELREKYRAEVLFTEEADGITNYYCYSPVFENSVMLCGYAVNFHVAVSKEQTAAGTPLIFGGY